MADPTASVWATPRTRRAVSAVVLAVASIALAWPLLTVEWLPFVDYPQHLATVAAIHGAHDPRWAPYFVVEYARSQYLLLYVLSDWLAYPLGVEAASRLTAVLSIAGLPLALAVYLRENGREPLLGAIAVPIALHVYVFWGFLNFAAGMTVGLLALAAFTRLSRQPTSRNAALFGVAALCTFYTHAQLYAWLALACGVSLLAALPTLGRKKTGAVSWRAALAALPSVAGLLYWLSRSGVIEHGEAGARSGHAAQVIDDPARFSPVQDTVRGWLGHSFEIYRDGAGIWVAAAFFAVVLLIVALRGGSPEPEPKADEARAKGDDSGPDEQTKEPPALARRVKSWLRGSASAPIRTYAPEAVTFLTFACYLFAPVSYRLIQPISHRFLPLALALLCCLGPRGRLDGRARTAIGALLVGLSVFVGIVHNERFRVLDDEMGELSQVLEHTEPGLRMMGLIYDPASETVPFATYLHAHQYYQARVGGLACFSFVEFPKSPVQYAPGAAPAPFPPRFEWTPQRYDHATWGEQFDYWLVRHPPGRPTPNPLRVRPDTPDAPHIIFESSRWTLFAQDPEAAE